MSDSASPRTFLYPLAAVAVVGALIYLQPSRDGEPPPDEVEQEAPTPPRDLPFEFVRSVPLPTPPAGRVDRLTEDPVERWLQRLLWAPPGIVIYTKDKIASLSDADKARFVERAREEWEANPVRAHVLLTAIGGFDLPEAHALIEEAALHSSALVRSEATRAFSMMDSRDAALRLEKLLYDTNTQVARAATQALIEMDGEPESLEVLRRYAEKNPQEGIRNVLFRIRRDSESPEAIEVLRQYVDRTDGTGQTALESLCLLGDPDAIDRCYAMLESPDEIKQLMAITFLSAAPPEMLDMNVLAEHLDHRQPEARRTISQMLLRIAKSGTAEDPERIAELLLEQSHDRDLRVHQVALAGLYALGRRNVAETYLKRIETATGDALHNAVDVASNLFRDPRSSEAIVQRLRADPELTSIDQSVLISGLCRTAAEPGADALVGFIRDARPDEGVDGNGKPLSYRTALESTSLGDAVETRLIDLLAEDGHHPYVYLRALDALRGIDGLDRVEELLDVATDPDRTPEVRAAALETLPYNKGADLYEAIMDVIDELAHPVVARSARLVLAVYS